MSFEEFEKPSFPEDKEKVEEKSEKEEWSDDFQELEERKKEEMPKWKKIEREENGFERLDMELELIAKRKEEELQEMLGKKFLLTKQCRLIEKMYENEPKGEPTERYTSQEVQRAIEWVETIHKEKYEEILAEKKDSSGELMEKLTTVILDKYLGSDFIIVRTTFFDDVRNKVDHLIIHRETGIPICAFDTYASQKSAGEILRRERSKKEEEKDRMLKDIIFNNKGAETKFGLTLKEIEGEKKWITSPLKNIPIYNLFLEEKYLYKAIKNLSSPKVMDDIFKKFLDQIGEQNIKYYEQVRMMLKRKVYEKPEEKDQLKTLIERNDFFIKQLQK